MEEQLNDAEWKVPLRWVLSWMDWARAEWKKEAVERLADLREETLEDTFTETPTNEMMKKRREEMLEPTLPHTTKLDE